MLVVTGDEDWPCLLPGIFIKRTCPMAALLVIPNSGHAVNTEEPSAFNAALADFLAQVDADRWPSRDPRAVSQSITGMTK
jgi:pimeloyl-ACP methyl ester carboxylesterase